MEKTVKKGQACKQLEQDSQNETDRTRLPGQNYQDETTRSVLLAYLCC